MYNSPHDYNEQPRISHIDMSQFEAAFRDGQLAPWIDDVMFERMNDLRDRMSDLRDVRDWKKEFLAIADESLDELIRIQQSLEEVIREIKFQKHPYEKRKNDIRQDMSADERKLQSLQREWARLMAELNARRNQHVMRNTIDETTENAPWRKGVNGKRALPHQFEGSYILSGAGKAILGDKPGLGKTLQAIMTIDMLRVMGMAKKVLIFCPKPVLDGFRREFEKWALPGQLVHVLNHTGRGVKSEILDLVKLLPECVILTNYEVWRKDKAILDKLVECQFDTIVLDEAHNLKDSKSSTFKGVRKVVFAENKCTNCGGFVPNINTCPTCGHHREKMYAFHSVKHVFPMTGTAILNKPQDLYALLHLIDPDAFPNEQAFLWDFCVKRMTDNGPRWQFSEGGEEMLLAKLGKRYTARSRESAGVVMPPQEIKHHYFELDPEKYPKQHEFNEMLKNNARLMIGDGREMTTTETIQWYGRMRQAATWPAGIKIRQYRDNELGEAIEVDPIYPDIQESIIMDEGELIIREALESGNRIVVFSKFKTALKEMQRRLNDISGQVIRYDGDLPDSLRIEAQHDFDLTITRPEKSKYKVMLAQYDAAKVGLNLHGAQEVLMLDREWNPGMEEQAMERVRRIGSEMDTIVHILHVDGTGTDLMDQLLAEKAAMRDGFDDQVNLQMEMRKFLGME